MKRGAGKVFEARQFRVVRDVQCAHAGDKHAGANAHSVAGACVPYAFGIIPNRFLETRIQPEIRRKPVMLDAAFQIVVDFLLAWIHARPFRRWRERKRIKVRWNIASAAGVTILPPGAADLFALIDDQKRFHAGFEKFYTHADAGKASADDEHVDVGDRRVGRRSGGFVHARATTSLFVSADAT